MQSEQPFNGFINLATINDSNYWLKGNPPVGNYTTTIIPISINIASSFVDMYEKGDYVYTFFREITVELDPNVSEHLFKKSSINNNIIQAVRSRVARICKVRNLCGHHGNMFCRQRDAGSHISGQQTFQTFIKSSIRCVVQGTGSSDERYNFPYYFDHLCKLSTLAS